nr:MAG TPA: hypothetical protein [Caudoviricetes sp.]
MNDLSQSTHSVFDRIRRIAKRILGSAHRNVIYISGCFYCKSRKDIFGQRPPHVNRCIINIISVRHAQPPFLGPPPTVTANRSGRGGGNSLLARVRRDKQAVRVGNNRDEQAACLRPNRNGVRRSPLGNGNVLVGALFVVLAVISLFGSDAPQACAKRSGGAVGEECDLVIGEEALGGLFTARSLRLIAQIVRGNSAKAEHGHKQRTDAVGRNIRTDANAAVDHRLDALVGRQLAQDLVGKHNLGKSVAAVRCIIDDRAKLTDDIRISAQIELVADIAGGNAVVDRHVKVVFLNGHLAGGEDFHLSDLGANLDRIGHQTHIVKDIAHNGVIGVHAVFGQQADALGLVDLALDEQLFNFGLVEHRARANLSLSIESVDSCHHRDGRARSKAEILSLDVLGLLVGENAVADVGRTRNRKVLRKFQTLSVRNKIQNISHRFLPPYLAVCSPDGIQGHVTGHFDLRDRRAALAGAPTGLGVVALGQRISGGHLCNRAIKIAVGIHRDIAGAVVLVVSYGITASNGGSVNKDNALPGKRGLCCRSNIQAISKNAPSHEDRTGHIAIGHVDRFKNDALCLTVIGRKNSAGGNRLIDAILHAKRRRDLMGLQHKADFAFKEVRTRCAGNVSHKRHTLNSLLRCSLRILRIKLFCKHCAFAFACRRAAGTDGLCKARRGLAGLKRGRISFSLRLMPFIKAIKHTVFKLEVLFFEVGKIGLFRSF